LPSLVRLPASNLTRLPHERGIGNARTPDAEASGVLLMVIADFAYNDPQLKRLAIDGDC
jgi:hypothetical protein